MFSSGFRLGRILGIPIYLHASWFIIFVLITLSLSVYFAHLNPHWTRAQHWTVGIATSLLFFGSVLFHELAHSVVALRYRIPVVSITLFVFGGIARIGREPSSAKQEFNIAVAGPISSYLLAAGFYALARALAGMEMLVALASWLAQINFLLATFNLIPGFPLDGGRILRSVVWAWKKDYARATRVAARGGQIFAYLLIFIGIWQALGGNFVGGLWLAFIGWFLLTAAQESYAQVAMRRMLEGLRAADIMSLEVPTIARDLSLEDFVRELFRTGRRCHLVVSDGQFVGMMNVHQLNRIPREEWATTSVQAAMLPPGKIHWVRPEQPLLSILERMQSEDVNQMPVVDGERIIGIVSRDSILRVLQNRMEIGELAEQ
jgi:Zn-dependent protease/CBS domain-containing protein